jgi:hypothetical protein
MAGTIKADVIQLGDSGTADNNFFLKTNGDGSASLVRGNNGSPTQDIITVDSTGNVSTTKTSAQSMVKLRTANGYGSTNTAIRRWSTVDINQGSDITYADSATLGASFTINTNGVYAISYSDQYTGATTAAIKLNGSQFTLTPASLTDNSILCSNTASAGGFAAICSWTGFLSAGDVIRTQSSTATGSNPVLAGFTIVRVS